MRIYPRAILLAALLSTIARPASPQSPHSHPSDTGPPKASIAGTVSIAGKPAAHITVVVLLDNNDSPTVARTATDEAGHFHLNNLLSGHYRVTVIAPTLAPAGEAGTDAAGKPVSLKDGQQLEGVDLPLVRGGVITGRVTTKDGAPVSSEQVELCPISDNGSKLPCRRNPSLEFGTDDRGIYRIYGIPPGRYTVSVGKDRTEMGGLDFRGNYARTFYPSTADQNHATPVEVTAGGEAAGIDIVLGTPVSTYRVTGRIVNAETGQAYAPGEGPAEVEVFDGPPFSQAYFSQLSGVADDKGRFEIRGGVVPGKYSATVRITGDNADIYSELTPLEVTNHDITNLELKVRRGSILSGVVLTDGQGAAAVIARDFAGLRIIARRWSDTAGSVPGDIASHESSGQVAPDGAFRIPGLRPGKISLAFAGFANNPPVRIVRIEGPGAVPHDHDMSVPAGYNYPDAVEIPEGANLSGLRVVVERGSAAINGHVKIVGGELPGGLSVYVFYRKVGAPASERYHAYVDLNGRFLIDGLPADEYLLETSVEPRGDSSPAMPPNIHQASKTVTLAEGEKSEMMLVIELNRKDSTTRQ